MTWEWIELSKSWDLIVHVTLLITFLFALISVIGFCKKINSQSKRSSKQKFGYSSRCCYLNTINHCFISAQFIRLAIHCDKFAAENFLRGEMITQFTRLKDKSSFNVNNSASRDFLWTIALKWGMNVYLLHYLSFFFLQVLHGAFDLHRRTRKWWLKRKIFRIWIFASGLNDSIYLNMRTTLASIKASKI